MAKDMYALVKETAAPGLTLTRIPIPEVGPLDVKIHIQKTSICGTDVHIYNWDEWSADHVKPPMAVGHEYAGIVAEVGEYVKTVKVGDRVSGEGHIVCGTCRNCLGGRMHFCVNTKGVGVDRPGSFAEYLVIPASNVVKLDDAVPDEIASIFDPLGNAVHTALKFDLVGEDVLVTGAGPIGTMSCTVAHHCGARHVVLTDFNEYRLNLAKEIDPKVVTVNLNEQKLEDVMKELGMVEGFDVGLEMSGSPQALESMIVNMKHGGGIGLLGLQGKSVPTNLNQIIMGGLTVIGIYGREMFETWYKMSAMIQSGLDLRKMITHRLDFRDYEEGFAAMQSGASGKVVLDWTTANESRT